MTAFELLLLVVVGDLIQQGVTQEDMSITGAMLAVGTIGGVDPGLLLVGLALPVAPATCIEGVPVVVVRDGEADRAGAAARAGDARRGAGVGPQPGHRRTCATSTSAILEPSGQFSFLQRKGGDERHSPPEKHKA